MTDNTFGVSPGTGELALKQDTIAADLKGRQRSGRHKV